VPASMFTSVMLNRVGCMAYWTPERVMHLRTLWDKGWTVGGISKKWGASYKAVEAKVWRLGLRRAEKGPPKRVLTLALANGLPRAIVYSPVKPRATAAGGPHTGHDGNMGSPPAGTSGDEAFQHRGSRADGPSPYETGFRRAYQPVQDSAASRRADCRRLSRQLDDEMVLTVQHLHAGGQTSYAIAQTTGLERDTILNFLGAKAEAEVFAEIERFRRCGFTVKSIAKHMHIQPHTAETLLVLHLRRIGWTIGAISKHLDLEYSMVTTLLGQHSKNWSRRAPRGAYA
jgi:hypothetical protein